MKNQRKRRLINPKVQITISATFAAIAVVALLLQSLFFQALLVDSAEKMPSHSQYLLDLVPQILGQSLIFSMGLVLPLVLAIGVLTTFRMVGPIYRFETYLRGVLRGNQLGPCKIRKGDAFQGLCSLINDVTEPQRRRAEEQASEHAQRREAV